MSSEHDERLTAPPAKQEATPHPVSARAEKIGQVAYELCATSEETDSCEAEFEGGDTTPLDDMRAWLRADPGRIARGKIPEVYYRAGSNINRIHQGYKLADPYNPLPNHAPARLLANYIRYHETYGGDDPSEITHGFLAELYLKFPSELRLSIR